MKLWWCAVAAPLFFACGGSVATGPGGGSAASGAEAGGASASGASGAGTGGAGTSGGASVGAPGANCEFQGNTYASGTSFPAPDGCNTCGCEDGSVGCTQIGCIAKTCQAGGQVYQPGQTFKIDCNTCTCLAGGALSCTLIACQDQCTALQDQYASALKRAKACDPTQPNPCTTTLQENLLCGCPTPANANDVSDLQVLTELAKQASEQCIALACHPCLSSPGIAACSTTGSCEILALRAGEAACKVGGVVYPHGASGIRPPGDCNACECINGELGNCTKMDCPSMNCPTGTQLGTQCAQCGPSDECQIVETACLPICTDTCANGACSNGLCRQRCG